MDQQKILIACYNLGRTHAEYSRYGMKPHFLDIFQQQLLGQIACIEYENSKEMEETIVAFIHINNLIIESFRDSYSQRTNEIREQEKIVEIQNKKEIIKTTTTLSSTIKGITNQVSIEEEEPLEECEDIGQNCKAMESGCQDIGQRNILGTFCRKTCKFSAIGVSSNPCQSPLLQRPGLTLTEELMDGQKVCCGFDKKINGYLPDGKKEDSILRKRPKGSKLICKNAITIPISNGNIVPKCPPKLFYDSNKDKCYLSAPGKPSDCPANKHRCNETIWYKLMTEQCPKTCNRCEEYIKLNISRDVRVCRDGIGPNGVSECPQNKHRCEEKIWKDFMKQECPETS
uniref:ShKT domain-containing protein n=1 Tax=Meloidogyne javanica TaxID=6303 RepID=A0A915LK19_MELJA